MRAIILTQNALRFRYAGHYGGAWYNQKKDFHKFPGAILMTSNCIMEPLATYRNHMFTTGAVSVFVVTI
jgi:hydroxylamine reductase